MRLDDRVRATLMHATARWTVRYGDDLRFAGSDLPAPERIRVPTRYGHVPAHVYRDPSWGPGPRPAYAGTMAMVARQVRKHTSDPVSGG